MKLAVVNEYGKELRKLDVDDSVFGIEPNMAVLHQAYVRQRNNNRQGNAKTKTVYVYPQTIPHGGLVDDWDESQGKLCRKLWRDMVWTTLRGVPATREPYDARAEKRPCTDGQEAWDELATAADDGTELPSTYYLGAQAKSAENVSFPLPRELRVLAH